MPIELLSAQLASQIAAGEVVERPSSVVKELVENAIDAGARTINVDVRQGGRRLIQVADDGGGIPGAELEMAFQRHATSKLRDVDDLKAIASLGFRGEALAAIAAVSQVTVVSRAEGEAGGTRLTLDGGHPTGRERTGAPTGTVIAVENLFFNVPARLKFLKSITTEKRQIDEFVTRYALAYPHIRFRLTHDGRVTFETDGHGRVQDVLVTIYGPETARQLLPLGRPAAGQAAAAGEDADPAAAAVTENAAAGTGGDAAAAAAGVTVTGFVGPPSLHWSNRGHITLFVNGRWIKDASLTYAVIQAYHTLLPTGRYPLGLLFVQLPATDVDVNVHPAKTEVRFHAGNRVFGAVQRAVRQTLIGDSPIRSLSGWQIGSQFETAAGGWGGELDGLAFGRRDAPPPQLGLSWSRLAAPESEEDHSAPEAPPALGGERLPIMRVVGQVGATFIITEGPDGMYLIDQHAAHERILYEQFMAARSAAGVASQRLMAGTAVHLSPSQATLLQAHLAELAGLGFLVEPFGPNAFMVRAIPAILARRDPAQALLAVVSDLENEAPPLQEEMEARLIRRVCKTAAVKAGQTLSRTEMEAMVQQLEACHNPHTCPHGRPTLIYLSVAQLARQFGRI